MGLLYFPLVLSCGHLASGSCDCYKGKFNPSPTGDGPIDRVLREFNGAWRQTLESYGCHLPNGRHHGPCPVCGGKDRFRFDDKDGRGTWFCSQCDPQSGGGLLLLSRYLGKPTVEVARELIGQDMPRTVAPVRKHTATDEQIIKENRARAKAGAALMLSQAIKSEHAYMSAKGLTGEWLVNGEIMMGANMDRIEPGDLLLVPVYKDGELVNMQKITKDGTKRPITGGDMSGVSHCIQGKENLIAVVEGYATGVTVNRMTGATTYVAFNTANLAAACQLARSTFPDAKLVIFADHDEHGAGLRYAEEAAVQNLSKIALPPEIGDWDDYRQKHGEDACKDAMREAIKLDGRLPEVTTEEAKPTVESTTEKTAEPERDVIDYAEINKSAAPQLFELLLPGNIDLPKQVMPAAGDGELPVGVSFDDLDVDHPPGLAGKIVDYIRAGAHRELRGGAYSAMAIQCMAMAGAGIPGWMGTKTSLITLTLAVSGGGKERAQDVIKEILCEAGRPVYGDIRSDKDILRTAVYDHGRCFYIVDEAHKFLNVESKGGNQHTATIPAVIMELATTGRLKLSRLHAEEFGERIMNSVSRKQKEKAAKETALAECNPTHDSAKIKQIEVEIEKINQAIANEELTLAQLAKGIPNPCLNLAGSSTPQKLAAIIDTDRIESGFLGRALIFDCGEKRSTRNADLWGVNPRDVGQLDRQQIDREIGLIIQMSEDATASAVDNEFNGKEVITVEPSEDAEQLIRAISSHYEQDRYLNHPQLGALYARICERIASVSSIMAFGNVRGSKAVIEVDYVRYSLMLVLASINHLASNLKLNEAAAGESIEAQLDGIKERIIRRLTGTGDEWVAQSAVKQTITKTGFYREIQRQLHGTGQDAFNNAIMSLELSGQIEVNGKKMRKKK